MTQETHTHRYMNQKFQEILLLLMMPSDIYFHFIPLLQNASHNPLNWYPISLMDHNLPFETLYHVIEFFRKL